MKLAHDQLCALADALHGAQRAALTTQVLMELAPPDRVRRSQQAG